ncbi:MAG: hypothetical protein AB8B66_04815 [Rickettsiaceae bacterium]
MPQFDISSFISQLFWLSIVFGLLYFLVSKVIAPKAESIFTARNRYFEDNVKYAQQFNDQIKLLEIQRQKNLIFIQEQIESVKHRAVQQADQYFHARQSELDIAIDKKHQESVLELTNYVNNFRQQQASYNVKTAAVVIEKITNKSANIEILQQLCGKM